MFDGLSAVKEVIDLRKADIIGDKFETNDLLMDDILIALGYNKRKDRGVKHINSHESSSKVDWEIWEDGKCRFIIKVYGYSLDKLPDIQEDEKWILDKCELFIKCDGLHLAGFAKCGKIVDIEDLFSADAEEVLSILSSSNYSYEKIMGYYERKHFDIDEALSKCKDKIITLISDSFGLTDADSRGKIALGISEVIECRKNNAELIKLMEGYKGRIKELKEENDILVEKLKNMEMEFEESESKNPTQMDVCRQLLDAIEDNPSTKRIYVGTINGKLFQTNELSKFIGTAIQELYAIVGFDIMHIIFDGAIFNLVKSSTRGDMMINGQSYDIDLSEMDENEIFEKIDRIFDPFKDRVVFLHKWIDGVVDVGTDGITDGTTDVAEESSDSNNNDKTDQVFENECSEISDNNSKCDQLADENISEDSESNEYFLALRASEVSSVIWSNNNPIIGIAAVSDGKNTFRLRDDSYEAMVNSAAVAFLAFMNKDISYIEGMHEINFSEASSFISLDEESGFRLLNTDYFVKVNKFEHAVMVIITLFNVFCASNDNEDSGIMFYFKINNSVDTEHMQGLTEKCSIDLESTYESLNNFREFEEVHCLLTGSGYRRMKHIPYSKNYIERLFKDAIAIRGSNYQFSVKSSEEVTEALKTLLARVDSNDVKIVIDKVNKAFSEDVISNSAGSIGDNAVKIDIGGEEYYIRQISCRDTVELFTNLHSLLYKNDAIDLRVRIDSKIYKYISEKVKTCDPFEYFIYSLLSVEIMGRVKVIPEIMNRVKVTHR